MNTPLFLSVVPCALSVSVSVPSPVATLLARDMRGLGMLILGTLSLIGMVIALDLGYGGMPGQRTSRTGAFKFMMEDIWLSLMLLD